MGSEDLASRQKESLTPEHIQGLRELLKENHDDSKLLVPGDDGYEASIHRWSAAAVKKAVSHLKILPL